MKVLFYSNQTIGHRRHNSLEDKASATKARRVQINQSENEDSKRYCKFMIIPTTTVFIYYFDINKYKIKLLLILVESL